MLDKKTSHPGEKSLATFVREQTIAYGVSRSELPGLLATVLGGSVPDETMNALMVKNLRELSQMAPEEFQCLPGINKTRAVRLAAAFELARRLAATPPEEKPAIIQPDNAARLVMEEMRNFDREHFRAILLDNKNRVITIDSVSVGSLNSTIVQPRELFKTAIKKSAKSIIMVHNHPSGDPAPSREDIDLTKRYIEVGDLIGIQVVDHIIIGDGRYVSLKARGVI